MKHPSTDWSLGEIQALAIKATRGAGYSWGMAEEAGFAVRWLESAGMPGCIALAAYLSTYLGSLAPVTMPPAAACPLTIGTQLLDHQRPHPISLGKLSYPILLVPFIAAYARQPCQFQWRTDTMINDAPDAVIHIGSNETWTALDTASLIAPSARCQTIISNNTEWCSASITRVPARCAQAIQTLSEWASKTYAPATRQSRLSGAGASGTDDD